MPPSPEDFQYEMNIVLSESVEPLLEESMSQWRVFGCQRPREPPYFYEDGLLLEMNLVAGVFECGSSCGKECASNRVVAKGICYPLEIFYTGKSKGWGVRCSADIPAGAFVCKYTGELRTDVEAEEMENDEYLFDLSNFIKMRKKYLKGTLDTGDEIVPLPFSDDELRKDDYHGRYLVIDGRCKGNVSRFINHACGEKINLVGQPVLTPPFSNGLFYDIAFFAIRHIPAYEELTYDYGYLKGDVNNRQLECHCGARDCKKWLL
ncbi:unnamed protein product [Ostreobium quekettii]|uniref:Histone-lysine N-methyltransferase n=1 Tax=Ostreobium quekettii TaxID=121088 RepID=A0A8S1J2G0_9CHLO|nr:unnamed protein product [Ostreobium quekettii]